MREEGEGGGRGSSEDAGYIGACILRLERNK